VLLICHCPEWLEKLKKENKTDYRVVSHPTNQSKSFIARMRREGVSDLGLYLGHDIGRKMLKMLMARSELERFDTDTILGDVLASVMEQARKTQDGSHRHGT
jgi:hypothetical protein